jgi:hypothetical protein
MELTDDMLRRIANNFADLRFKYGLLRQVAVQMGVNPAELDRATNETLETPEFQQLRDQIFEQLKGGH